MKKFIYLLLALLVPVQSHAGTLLFSTNGVMVYEASLTAAIGLPATVGKTLVVTGPETVDNITIPSTVALEIKNGGLITRNSGKTLTINGPFTAPLTQIFTGSGALVFGPGSVNRIYSAWFATGDTEAQTVFDAMTSAEWIKTDGTLAIKKILSSTKANYTSSSTPLVSSSSMPATVLSSASAGNSFPFNNTYKAIKLVADSTGNMASITFAAKKDAGVTQSSYLFGSLYTNNSGVPGVEVVAAQGVIYAQQLSSSAMTDVDLFIAASGLTPGATYWYVFRKVVSGGSIYFDGASSETNECAYSDNGTTWTAQAYKLKYTVKNFTGNGLYGFSTNWRGVQGESINTQGVYGKSTNSSGVNGESVSGGGGSFNSVNSYGVRGVSQYDTGVKGSSESTGGLGGAGTGVGGSSESGYGGYFTSAGGTGLFAGTTTGTTVLDAAYNASSRFRIKWSGAVEMVQANAANVDTPVASYYSLYFDSADGKLKFKDSAGTVHTVTSSP